MKRWLSWILVGLLLLLGMPLALRLWAKWHYQALIYHDVDQVPAYPVGIVLGAGVYPDGRLTPVLEDRVNAAIDLYWAAKVERLLFTGDNRTTHYNEPGRMFEYAVAQGLPPEAIVLDYAGRRTYDSCYRARTIFQVEQAIVITQDFHQPRALFLCERLGLEVVGLTADQRPYPGLSRMWWQTREIPALALAWWDVNIRRPIPVLGDPLPIFKVAEWR